VHYQQNKKLNALLGKMGVEKSYNERNLTPPPPSPHRMNVLMQQTIRKDLKIAVEIVTKTLSSVNVKLFADLSSKRIKRNTIGKWYNLITKRHQK